MMYGTALDKINGHGPGLGAAIVPVAIAAPPPVALTANDPATLYNRSQNLSSSDFTLLLNGSTASVDGWMFGMGPQVASIEIVSGGSLYTFQWNGTTGTWDYIGSSAPITFQLVYASSAAAAPTAPTPAPTAPPVPTPSAPVIPAVIPVPLTQPTAPTASSAPSTPAPTSGISGPIIAAGLAALAFLFNR